MKELSGTILGARLEQVPDSNLLRSEKYQPAACSAWECVLVSFGAASAPSQHRDNHGWCCLALSKWLTQEEWVLDSLSLGQVKSLCQVE